MPDSYFQLGRQNQASALAAASEVSGRAPHLLEKDIWVVWALSTLFQSELGAHLVFKGGTALSKAQKVITRFSEDVDLTYDIRALAPELVRGAAGGIDAIPPSRSQEKKWSDEIRRELLPAWIRNHAHPVIQAGLERLVNVSSRITEDCIFIDYEPVAPASGYALPAVKLEFGARSSGEPSTIIPVRCDMERLVSGVEFPTAEPRVMNLTRIFWEKATAAHVYCSRAKRALAAGFRGTSTILFVWSRPDIFLARAEASCVYSVVVRPIGAIPIAVEAARFLTPGIKLDLWEGIIGASIDSTATETPPYNLAPLWSTFPQRQRGFGLRGIFPGEFDKFGSVLSVTEHMFHPVFYPHGWDRIGGPVLTIHDQHFHWDSDSSSAREFLMPNEPEWFRTASLEAREMADYFTQPS